LCIVEYLPTGGRPEALPLMLRHNAKRMKFKVSPTFNGHKEPHFDAITLNNLREKKLKLFAELTPLSSLIPKSATGRDRYAHGPQKHLFEESDILIVAWRVLNIIPS
jgi:hypothetical protein